MEELVFSGQLKVRPVGYFMLDNLLARLKIFLSNPCHQQEVLQAYGNLRRCGGRRRGGHWQTIRRNDCNAWADLVTNVGRSSGGNGWLDWLVRWPWDHDHEVWGDLSGLSGKQVHYVWQGLAGLNGAASRQEGIPRLHTVQ
jgi:hypothetical protein